MVLFIQNNATRQIYVYQNLSPAESNHLWIRFEDMDLGEIPDGEYTYALIAGNEIEYTPKAVLLDTLIADTDMTLKDLQPAIGLLRVGIFQEKNVYNQPEEPKHYYYKPN